MIITMVGIPNEKLRTVKYLYYQRKQSARKIAEVLNVSIWSVYKFMERHNLGRRSFTEENALRFARKKPSFIIKKRLTSKDRELKAIGAALYWGEGYKKEGGYGIDFSNSEPNMIKLFLKFLRDVCGIQEKRLRVLLYCYSNQNPKRLIDFWSNLAKIPKNQFSKPYVRKDFKLQQLGKMPFGLIHIRYADKKLLIKVKEWINKYVEKYA